MWWKRDGVVGWSGNLSCTYWVVVIRPRLSRTATASMWDSGNRPIAILDRPEQENRLVCFIDQEMCEGDANTKNHVEHAQSMAASLHETGTGVVQRPNTT